MYGSAWSRCDGAERASLRATATTALFFLFATSGRQTQTPFPKCRVLPMRAKNMVRTLDQQTSEIDVASLCDAELRITITRLASSWS